MEFSIRNVYFKADEWEVTTEIAHQALHICPGLFITEPKERLPNFKVQLNKRPAGGVQNDGTGSLTLTQSHGRMFQCFNDQNLISVEIGGRKLKFLPTGNPIEKSLHLELERAPFIDPGITKDRVWRIEVLRDPFYITYVQIGTFYRPEDTRLQDSCSFSIEWSQDLSKQSMGLLFFEYERKSLRVQIGDQNKEATYSHLIIPFSSINKMVMGRELGHQKPYVCFDLLTPPAIQKEVIHHSTEMRKYRCRASSVDDRHREIAPYAHQLRITLYETDDVFEKFHYYCQTSSLRSPGQGVVIDANACQKFFHRKKIRENTRWLKSLLLSSNWRVAFQVEALLRNAVANTKEVKALRPRVKALIHGLGDLAGDFMRRFVEAATRRPLGQRVLECFESALQKRTRPPRMPCSKSSFFCHHVTFTPTRRLLEGPIITRSNRVIREYEGYEDHFLRVDFRDEDRLPYKRDREVDSVSHLHEHVGTLLKKGFELAGRKFEFLGYSSSSLKEHAVWYFNPFNHPTKGWVTAQRIRNSLGDFRKVITSPSKYGARMAQAFTSTNPSVRIGKDQWTVIPDIELEVNGKKINFTDGVGTISPGLAEQIWEALCADDPSLSASVVPSAYQIRFLGCKGVVSVDARLEGIQMCVRPSMNKFDVPGEDYGSIEIADFFGRPNIPYLNRPLVMVLEDRGAPKEVFLELQKDVVAVTRMAHDSAALYAKLLESNQLCYNFRLATILRRLNGLGLELKPNPFQQLLDTPFFARLRACAINHVLRVVKYEARIQIPDSYMLVGVADEGPAYVKSGLRNVYCLEQGNIFACVQNPGDDMPRYLKGPCLVLRNPVIHPGDVQRVYAIGPPPNDRICLFGHLKNVVVFSSTGTWSLPNGLGGGDLDGDRYIIIQHGDLLVPEHHDPASYPKVEPFKLDRPSTIDDVCDFIVEYINSDVVGLVATRHLTIADQSKLGTLDPDCIKLAEMFSWAVDYPKNGNSVDIRYMPRKLIDSSPDWSQADQDSTSSLYYYASDRALGHLYRNITLDDIPNTISPYRGNPEEHPISKAIYPHVRRHLSELRGPTQMRIEALYTTYREELTYISGTYSLSKAPGSRLSEEELVIGTILARCRHKGYRSNRLHDMRENVGFLVQEIREQLIGRRVLEGVSKRVLREALAAAWRVWTFSIGRAGSSTSPSADEDFGLESFGLIGLGLALDCLEKLGSLPPL